MTDVLFRCALDGFSYLRITTYALGHQITTYIMTGSGVLRCIIPTKMPIMSSI
jgi:hypothetical protein